MGTFIGVCNYGCIGNFGGNGKGNYGWGDGNFLYKERGVSPV